MFAASDSTFRRIGQRRSLRLDRGGWGFVCFFGHQEIVCFFDRSRQRLDFHRVAFQNRAAGAGWIGQAAPAAGVAAVVIDEVWRDRLVAGIVRQYVAEPPLLHAAEIEQMIRQSLVEQGAEGVDVQVIDSEDGEQRQIMVSVTADQEAEE